MSIKWSKNGDGLTKVLLWSTDLSSILIIAEQRINTATVTIAVFVCILWNICLCSDRRLRAHPFLHIHWFSFSTQFSLASPHFFFQHEPRKSIQFAWCRLRFVPFCFRFNSPQWQFSMTTDILLWLSYFETNSFPYKVDSVRVYSYNSWTHQTTFIR